MPDCCRRLIQPQCHISIYIYISYTSKFCAICQIINLHPSLNILTTNLTTFSQRNSKSGITNPSPTLRLNGVRAIMAGQVAPGSTAQSLQRSSSHPWRWWDVVRVDFLGGWVKWRFPPPFFLEPVMSFWDSTWWSWNMFLRNWKWWFGCFRFEKKHGNQPLHADTLVSLSSVQKLVQWLHLNHDAYCRSSSHHFIER